MLAREKTLVATRARHVASDLPLKGYEIHHGRTTAAGDARPAVIRDDGEAIGFCSADGRILGTYLHGLFDADGFRRWFIDRLRTRRGLAPVGNAQTVYDIEPALERLAEHVRSHLDMKAVYSDDGAQVNEFVPHIWLALGLDLLVGDPRWFPHPVRLIGRLAQSLETPARRVLKQPWLAGIVVACSVIGATGLLTWGIV